MRNVTFFKSFLPLKKFGTDFRFLRNRQTSYHVHTEMRQSLVHCDAYYSIRYYQEQYCTHAVIMLNSFPLVAFRCFRYDGIPANMYYRKNTKNSDISKICCNHPKIWTTRLYHRVMLLKDADGIANSVDPEEQSDLGLHYLPRPICPKTLHYTNFIWMIILNQSLTNFICGIVLISLYSL